MYLDLIFNPYDVKDSKCLYMDEVVKLSKYELDYHPRLSAIIHDDVMGSDHCPVELTIDLD